MKILERRGGTATWSVNLVSSVFLVTGPTIDGSALCGLERHFSFSAAVRTCNFVHSSAAVSFLTHNLLTPLYRLVTPEIILKSRIHSVPNFSKHRSVIKAMLQAPVKISVYSRNTRVFPVSVTRKQCNFKCETEKVTFPATIYTTQIRGYGHTLVSSLSSHWRPETMLTEEEERGRLPMQSKVLLNPHFSEAGSSED